VGARRLVRSATFLNTDAIRPDFDPSAQWGCVVGETDQESRSTGRRGARSVTVMSMTTKHKGDKA
jgi:hypothetical protein